ncbi:MAG: hypothetical protein CM1200mP24_04330 [Gammaproteobacteria bacterium]|nr:MAG: hypothetical protein CM1200mP24_04330 [Gammaproteobacteria bacterium]
MCFTKKLVIFFMVIFVPQTLLGGEGRFSSYGPIQQLMAAAGFGKAISRPYDGIFREAR